MKVDFNFKRERPVGPHKHKTPNLIDPRWCDLFSFFIYTLKQWNIYYLLVYLSVDSRALQVGVY